MTDYQCTCRTKHYAGSGRAYQDENGCILHDPKLKGSLMVCQRLDKLNENLDRIEFYFRTLKPTTHPNDQA